MQTLFVFVRLGYCEQTAAVCLRLFVWLSVPFVPCRIVTNCVALVLFVTGEQWKSFHGKGIIACDWTESGFWADGVIIPAPI